MLNYRFIPHAVKVTSAQGSTTTWINQIQSTEINDGRSLFEESGSSEYDRAFVATKEIAPTISIATTDLTALATVGFGGLFIYPSSSYAGVSIYGRAWLDGGLPAPLASDDHVVCLVTDGIMVPQSVRAGHNTTAQLSLMLYPNLGNTLTYSGATPLVYSTDVEIPTGATATENIYAAGPVKYTPTGGSGTLLQGIKDLSCDFGLQVVRDADSSEVYQSFQGIVFRAASITFTTADASEIAAIGDGTSVSAFAMYFRNVAASGQRVAPGSSDHISIVGTAGMIIPTSQSLRHKQAGTAAFRYIPVLNTNQLVISTTAEIPTT